MVQPKQGRGRRVIASSDDEDELPKDVKPKQPPQVSSVQKTSNLKNSSSASSAGAALPTRSRSKPLPRPPASQSTTASPTPTPDASPEKGKTKKEKKDVGKSTNSRTIYSFFNAATEKLQQNSQSTQQMQLSPEVDDVDAIEDDFSFATTKARPTPKTLSGGTTISTKRPLSASSFTSAAGDSSAAPPSSKYLKALNGHRASPAASTPPIEDSDTRPWAEKYGPTNLDELVVHKNKTAAVQDWLSAALGGQPYRNVLILKGPAGAGKTATLDMLSKSLKFDIVEWKNPATSDFLAEDYVSASAQFGDFLLRGRSFNSLDLVCYDGQLESEKVSEDSAPRDSNQLQVILVEDFPYAVFRMDSAVQSLRSALLQCLAARPPPGQRPSPIVLIITESILSNNTSSAENFTAHRLLGPDILHHPAATMIEFNPVAPTFITKALNATVQKHRKNTGIVLTPDPDVVRAIAQIGDVRNAVATLEFLSARNEIQHTTSALLPIKGKARGTKAKAKSKATTGSASTATNLSLLSLRESSIGLFHAVGKVVYNKRSAQGDSTIPEAGYPGSDEPDPLPQHLSHHTRSLPSEVSISTLIDETGTDTSTFLSALHENYVLSCASPSGYPEATLDTINACLDHLSDSAILYGSVSTSFFNRSGVNEGVRQEELAFEASVRGLLHALPHPVKRQAHPGRSGGKGGMADAHRMFYPTDLKIWRKREEVLGLLDMLVGRAQDGSLLAGIQWSHNNVKNATSKSISQPGRMPSAPPSQRFKGGVESWRRSASREGVDPSSAENYDGPSAHVALGSGHSARQEMLLERLPYLAHILLNPSNTKAVPTFGANLARQMLEITSFTGIGALQGVDELDEVAEVPKMTTGVGQRATSGAVPWVHKVPGITEDELDVRGLVLSDDDIEDD